MFYVQKQKKLVVIIRKDIGVEQRWLLVGLAG